MKMASLIDNCFQLLIWVAIFAPNAIAENHILSHCYTYGGAESTDLQIREPIGFINISDSLFKFVVNSRYEQACESTKNAFSFHHYILKSEDGESIIFPPLVSPMVPDMSPLPAIELRATVENEDADVEDKIIRIADADMSGYCNADTAYIYEMTLPTPYKSKYTHCIGVYLRKYAHPAALAKILITDSGLKNKDRYLAALLRSIKYGDLITKEGRYWEKINADQKCDGSGYMEYGRLWLNGMRPMPSQLTFPETMIR